MGDLRLECRVGMASGLVSNPSTLVGRLVKRVLESPGYCDRQVPQYLFFADRALFSVMLNGGGRRESLSIDKLYAGAIDNPRLAAELPYCDCESLVDRTFVLPLGDLRWANDTVLSFEYMDEP